MAAQRSNAPMKANRRLFYGTLVRIIPSFAAHGKCEISEFQKEKALPDSAFLQELQKDRKTLFWPGEKVHGYLSIQFIPFNEKQLYTFQKYNRH